MNHEMLLVAFGVFFILNFGAFGMQRATLILSREAEISPRIGALLLPSWYPIVWLVILAKWVVLGYIAFTWSWVVACGLLVSDFMLSAILPIPYRIYLPTFRSRIREIKENDVVTGIALDQMLNSSRISDS